jgi:hypothetical protein
VLLDCILTPLYQIHTHTRTPAYSAACPKEFRRLLYREEELQEGAVPRLRRLVAGLPPRRPGFDPGSVHVGFVVDKVSLGQVFPPSTSVFPCQFNSTGAPLRGKKNHLHQQDCTISLKAAVRPEHLLRGP